MHDPMAERQHRPAVQELAAERHDLRGRRLDGRALPSDQVRSARTLARRILRLQTRRLADPLDLAAEEQPPSASAS